MLPIIPHLTPPFHHLFTFSSYISTGQLPFPSSLKINTIFPSLLIISCHFPFLSNCHSCPFYTSILVNFTHPTKFLAIQMSFLPNPRLSLLSHTRDRSSLNSCQIPLLPIITSCPFPLNPCPHLHVIIGHHLLPTNLLLSSMQCFSEAFRDVSILCDLALSMQLIQ